VIYVSGDAFFVNGTGKNFVRLSFSAPTPDRIREGVRRLGSAVTEELEAVKAAARAAAEGSAPPRLATP
jgi:DNA-binding transcriptional MocR family regulator